MKKYLPIVVVLVVIAIIVGVAVGHKNSNPASNSSTTSNTTPPASNNSSSDMSNTNSSSSSTSSSTPTSTDKVTISNFSFSPASITVKKGTTVTWTNNDTTAHTATSDNVGIFDSGTLENGKTYSHTFDTAGTFKYHCTFHSDMHGTVTVTE
jgi:plastocyanin